MSALLLRRLMGERTLDQVIESRGHAIKAIGQRSASYKFKTVKSNGYSHTELYPKTPATRKRKEGSSF